MEWGEIEEGGVVEGADMMCPETETKLGEGECTVCPHPTQISSNDPHVHTYPSALLQLHPAKRGGGWKEEKERKQEYQINEKFSYRPRFRAFHASNNN